MSLFMKTSKLLLAVVLAISRLAIPNVDKVIGLEKLFISYPTGTGFDMSCGKENVLLVICDDPSVIWLPTKLSLNVSLPFGGAGGYRNLLLAIIPNLNFYITKNLTEIYIITSILSNLI